MIEKIRRIISREAFLVTVMIAGMIALSIFPIIIKWSRAPIGHDFIPVHNSLSDYPFYTSIIRQGLDRQILVFNRFTSEPQTGTIFVGFYLFLGWIGSLIGLTSAHTVYHLSRIILGVIWILVIYRFINWFFSGKGDRLTALFLSVFSASFPIIQKTASGMSVSWHMFWWSELDPIQRATFLPHYLLGHIMMILIIGFFLTGRIRWPQMVLCSILGFIAGFTHPPSLILPAIILPLYSLIRGNLRLFIKAVVVMGLSSVSFAVILISSSRFPWTMSRGFENLSFAVNIREYLMALGPVFVMGTFGFITKLINYRDKKGFHQALLLSLWTFVSLMLLDRVRFFPFSPYAIVRQLAISNIRFLQVALWVPLSIGSVWALSAVRQKFGRGIYILVMAILAILTFIGYPQSFRFQADKIYGDRKLTYPQQGFIQAIKDLEAQVPPDKIIWSLPLSGLVIPTYINRTVYTGNEIYQTNNIDLKMGNAWKFYTGNIDSCQAYKLLKDNRVGAVFYGFNEQDNGDAVNRYAFILPWRKYQDGTVIYLFTDARPEGCE